MNKRRVTNASLERRMIHMSAELDKLTSDVAAEKTVNDSAIALISGLSAQLTAALASGNPTAAVQQLATDLESTQAALAAAVTAGTPAVAPATSATPPATPPAA
jgi:hypothetical protein